MTNKHFFSGQPKDLIRVLTSILILITTGVPAAIPTRAFGANGTDPLVFNQPKGTRLNRFCGGQVGYGPLRLQSQSPFQSLRLQLTPMAPTFQRPGTWETGATMSLANVWANSPGHYRIDYESLDTTIFAAYGLSKSLRLEFGFQEKRLFGGILDGFIADFHDFFGIDQDGRDTIPFGLVEIEILDDDGNPLISYNQGSGVYSRSITAYLEHRLTCGSDKIPALSYSLSARYDTEGQHMLDRDFPIDLGLSIMTAKKLGPVNLYLSAGLFWYGSSQIQRVKLKKVQTSLMAGLEWRFGQRHSLLAQCLISEGAAEDLGPFSDASYEVTLGWKWEVIPNGLFELGLIENIIIWDNSPDFGLHSGFSYRF